MSWERGEAKVEKVQLLNPTLILITTSGNASSNLIQNALAPIFPSKSFACLAVASRAKRAEKTTEIPRAPPLLRAGIAPLLSQDFPHTLIVYPTCTEIEVKFHIFPGDHLLPDPGDNYATVPRVFAINHLETA